MLQSLLACEYCRISLLPTARREKGKMSNHSPEISQSYQNQKPLLYSHQSTRPECRLVVKVQHFICEIAQNFGHRIHKPEDKHFLQHSKMNMYPYSTIHSYYHSCLLCTPFVFQSFNPLTPRPSHTPTHQHTFHINHVGNALIPHIAKIIKPPIWRYKIRKTFRREMLWTCRSPYRYTSASLTSAITGRLHLAIIAESPLPKAEYVRYEGAKAETETAASERGDGKQRRP